MRSIENLIKEGQADLREHRLNDLAARLTGLRPARVPRRYRLEVAWLCTAAGLQILGLRVLKPLVRPRRSSLRQPATSAELIMYARILALLGNPKESLEILGGIDGTGDPEALLYSAVCKIKLWNYRDAVVDLRKYISLETRDYYRAIAQLNLSMCHSFFDDFASAEAEISHVFAVAEKTGNPQLRAIALKELARAHVEAGRLIDARKYIDEAILIFGDADSPNKQDALSVLTYIEALELDDPFRLRARSREAEANGRGMIVPEITLKGLLRSFNQDKFDRLMFGMPYAEFRERAERKLGRKSRGGTFVLGPRETPCFDLSTGEIDGRPGLNPGKKIHQLVEVLLRDFYSPLKLGGLFRELFPGEYFDPDSSPGRVHQLIWRARRRLENSDIPVEISENEGEYRLKIIGQFSFRVPYERAGIDSIQVLYGRLKNEIGTERSFAASDACRALGLSRSGFKAFAARAVARGLLSRVGTHSRTRYSFAHAIHSAA